MANVRRKGESAADFLAVWTPAVQGGKSLKEIADLFGDGRKPADVSVKASQIRAKMNERVEGMIDEWEKANSKKMAQNERDELYNKVLERVPMLKRGIRGNTAVDELSKELTGFMETLSKLQANDANKADSTVEQSEAQPET
jgi:hypothetical protein